MTNRTHNAADYPEIFTVPLPPKPKRGPKPGARRSDLKPYIEIARGLLASGDCSTFEQAAYRVTKRASEKFDVDFDELKAFLRHHLKS